VTAGDGISGKVFAADRRRGGVGREIVTANRGQQVERLVASRRDSPFGKGPAHESR